MRLHHQPRALLMEPPATISIAQLHEVHRSVMLSRPIAVIDPVYGRIHQHDAPRTQQRHHSPVGHSDISVDMMAIAVREHTLKVAPLFHHPRQEFRSPRIERRVKFHRCPQRRRRRHQMRLRHGERCSIMKTLLHGNVVPTKDLQGVQPVEGRQRIQFVQTRHNSPVFNIRQPADVKNEVGTPSARGQFIAGTFYITIG